MASKVKPPPGQQCECSEHDSAGPMENLQRVFFQRKKFCHEWWCKACHDREGIEPMEEGWPQGDDGRFMTSVHCPVIPGLD